MTGTDCRTGARAFDRDAAPDMTPRLFLLVFLAALAAMVGVRLWLAARQIAHVRTHRGEVPAAFASRIGIAAHQKAADYTIARQSLGRVETVVDAIVLLSLTVVPALAVQRPVNPAPGVLPDSVLFASAKGSWMMIVPGFHTA